MRPVYHGWGRILQRAASAGVLGSTAVNPYRVIDTGPPIEASLHGRAPALWQRPFSEGGAAVDRMALRVMEKLFLSGGRAPPLDGRVRVRIEQARAMYDDPAIYRAPERYFRPPGPISVSVHRLSKLPRGERLRVGFDSPWRTWDPDYAARYSAWDRNARNRIHLWEHRERGRPTALCIHGWCGGRLTATELLFDARSLYRLGLNVAFFTMPFHGSRTPKEALFSGQLFPSRDLKLANEAFGQAVCDLQALRRWLREERGSGPIGLLGYSLGGYTAALLASLDPTVAFVVPVIAPASFADVMWHHGRGRPQRQAAERRGVTLDDMRALWGIHCPLRHELRIPKERALIVWGQGDRIVPTVHQVALWEHWDRPRSVSFRGSHILHFGRRGFMKDIRRFLRTLVD